MSEELKPCPFCGGEAIFYDGWDSCRVMRTYGVCCTKCSEKHFKPEYAISHWNTRPLEDEKDKEIARLKEDLEIQKNLTRQACLERNRAYDETEKWKKMLCDLVYKQARVNINPPIVIVGKDTDVPANATDNDVGSMENLKGERK